MYPTVRVYQVILAILSIGDLSLNIYYIFRESLVQLTDATIEMLDLTVGQKLMLKEAVKKLKNGEYWFGK